MYFCFFHFISPFSYPYFVPQPLSAFRFAHAHPSHSPQGHFFISYPKSHAPWSLIYPHNHHHALHTLIYTLPQLPSAVPHLPTNPPNTYIPPHLPTHPHGPSINHYTHPYTNVMLSFHIFLYLTCISFICAFFIYTAYTPRTPTAPHPHLFYLNPLLPFHPPICKLAAKSSFIKEMYVLVYNLYDRSPLKYEKEWMWKLI